MHIIVSIIDASAASRTMKNCVSQSSFLEISKNAREILFNRVGTLMSMNAPRGLYGIRA